MDVKELPDLESRMRSQAARSGSREREGKRRCAKMLHTPRETTALAEKSRERRHPIRISYPATPLKSVFYPRRRLAGVSLAL
jgi:hypothetical protein